jgi:hypothetical protein
MLKRLTLSLAVLILSTALARSPAHASPETAEYWGIQAKELYKVTAQLLTDLNAGQTGDLEADYLDNLADFSVIAGRLAVWVDTSGGARDFSCIYRGMAEEAERQLDALETAKDKAQAHNALTRIATLLDDAQNIAVASAHAARSGTSTAPTGHCPASAIPLDKYLGAGS